MSPGPYSCFQSPFVLILENVFCLLVLTQLYPQKTGRKRAGKVTRQRENVIISNVPRSLRRAPVGAPIVEEEEDYELPKDEVYIPVEEETSAAAEKAKLESLEAELARLRAEMALFMAQASANASSQNVLQMSSSQDANQASSSAAGSSSSLDPLTASTNHTFTQPSQGQSTSNQHTQPRTSFAPPPPPPPPAASFSSSLMQSSASSPALTTTSATFGVENTNNVASSSSLPKPAPSTSLSDMVKGSNRQLLRKVEGERSPGGTVKKQPSEMRAPANPNDPAEVIAQALRRRFKSVSGSPDTKNPQSRISTDPSDFD